jgi:hypothetical protein
MGDSKEERRQFWIKVSLAILFLFCAANIFLMLFIVPKFEQIYKDALAGSGPLPPLTAFIIHARSAIALIDLVWPILGSVLIWQKKPYAILWINLGIIGLFLQVGITVVALFTPMVGYHGGMSDQP